MSFSHKIDEWLKEAEERPESALTIVKLVARRLRELTERNEELLAENIALQNGTRVEEYQKRIAHLEYQLELLKRRFGTDDISALEVAEEISTLNLLAYNASGRIIRIELTSDAQSLGRITGEMTALREPPRLLGAPSNEEVLLLFTSGRISTHTVSSISAVEIGGTCSWDEASLPDEPRAGETLACIIALSQLPLSDSFLQVSRRGYVKKTMTSIAGTVFENHFLGKGSVQKSDQPFDVALCQKGERFGFVTHEGHLLGLDVDALSYATEERISLTANDYVVASFITGADESIIFVTQNGKVIHRDSESLELSKSPLAKGQTLISPARLEQGVRFVGAASVHETDSIAVLDVEGNLSLHVAGSMTGAGSIEAGGLVLSIGRIPAGSAS